MPLLPVRSAIPPCASHSATTMIMLADAQSPAKSRHHRRGAFGWTTDRTGGMDVRSGRAVAAGSCMPRDGRVSADGCASVNGGVSVAGCRSGAAQSDDPRCSDDPSIVKLMGCPPCPRPAMPAL